MKEPRPLLRYTLPHCTVRPHTHTQRERETEKEREEEELGIDRRLSGRVTFAFVCVS